MSEDVPFSPWLITVDQAAKLLCISRSKLYQMIARREVPHVRLGGDADEHSGSIRINPVTLREWLTQLEAENQPHQVSKDTVNKLMSSSLKYRK